MKTTVQRVRPCSLDAATQKLIANIFSKDMFNDAMALMNLGEGRGARQGGQGRGVARAESPHLPRCEEDAPGKVEQAADCPGL